MLRGFTPTSSDGVLGKTLEKASELRIKALHFNPLYLSLSSLVALEYHNLNTSADTKDFWVITGKRFD